MNLIKKEIKSRHIKRHPKAKFFLPKLIPDKWDRPILDDEHNPDFTPMVELTFKPF